MWETDSSGEVKTLLDANLTDLVYIQPEHYWLGSPSTSDSSIVWYVNGYQCKVRNDSISRLADFLCLRPVIKILASKIS